MWHWAFVPRNLRESRKSLLIGGAGKVSRWMDGFVVTGHLKQNLKKLSPGRHEPVSYNLAFCVCFGSELNGPPMESISRSQRAHRPASWCSFNTTPRPPLAARFREILVIFHSSGTLELQKDSEVSHLPDL